MPAGRDLSRIRDGRVAEDVRMPPHQFVAHTSRHVPLVERARLRPDPSLVHQMIENVPQLFCDLLGLPPVDCVEKLVGLLEQHRLERLLRLLTVPRTPVRPAQIGAQSQKTIEGGREVLGHGGRLPSTGRTVYKGHVFRSFVRLGQ